MLKHALLQRSSRQHTLDSDSHKFLLNLETQKAGLVIYISLEHSGMMLFVRMRLLRFIIEANAG